MPETVSPLLGKEVCVAKDPGLGRGVVGRNPGLKKGGLQRKPWTKRGVWEEGRKLGEWSVLKKALD